MSTFRIAGAAAGARGTVWGNFDIVPCIVVIIVIGRLLTLFRLSKKTRFDKILETNYFENETMQILS